MQRQRFCVTARSTRQQSYQQLWSRARGRIHSPPSPAASAYRARRTEQLGHRGLGEALILSLQVGWHRDVFYVGLFAQGDEQRVHQSAERFGRAGAKVEETADLWSIGKHFDYLSDILDVDEIAELAAVRIVRPVGLKEAHTVLFTNLVPTVEDH